ncbi:hypothetical protein Bca101_075064 [Brassica carinata]
MRVSLLQVGVSMSINRSVLLLSKPSSQSDYSLQVGVSKVLLSDLTSGRCSSRLLRFWEVRNVKHCGELMCVDLLLLDSKVVAVILPLIRTVLCIDFTFPERPGALMNFLDSFSPRWNISLYHAEVCI